MTDDELYEKGIAIREEMLGPEHGRAKVESQGDFTREFEELVTRYCFGSVWGREQLPRGIRSMLTIAMLVALGRAQEIRWHVQGAINNGVDAHYPRAFAGEQHGRGLAVADTLAARARACDNRHLARQTIHHAGHCYA